MVTSERKLLRWTKRDYYKMAEIGLFDGKHVELIEGEIVEMSPMGTLHWVCVTLTGDALRKVFDQGYFIATQLPLDLGESTEPEPDVAVIRGNVRDYRDAHPTTAALIVEVADTSLSYDRADKASLYAKAGIAEYWIVNLLDNQCEVHRQPVPMPDQPFGFGYASVTTLKATDTVSPLAAPHATIAVADLLP
ncbi:MAG: Uma2 family endonuclease [Abditibacteriales bacterium]|nr:Uma2 family endonuclease [Abditibacteriales bacterium]MDW8364539.1 Uma2 family endonuclease [Abditibacteriales bacterium]